MLETDAAFDILLDEPTSKSSSAVGPLGSNFDWPEAEPFNTARPAKPFPLWALPALINAAVIEAQSLTQAPVEMVVASALSAASLATQGHADVARDAALIGPIGIYNITVGLSGERKSAIDGKLWAGCRNAADYLRERREHEIALIQPKMAIWESRRDAIDSALRTVMNGKSAPSFWVAAFHTAQNLIPGTPPPGPPSPQALTRFLEGELIAHHANKPIMPKAADLLHSDNTTEALAESLAAGWPVAAVAESEGGTVFGGIAMQKERVMQTFASWNVLWGGGRITHKRTSVESRRVRDVRMTINLMVQPAVLARVLNDNSGLIRDIGLHARFLFCCPQSTMGSRQYQPPTQTPKAIVNFNDRCYELLVNVPLPHPIIANGAIDTTRVRPAVWPLSTTAHAIWVNYYNQIESALTGRFDDAKDVASKAAEQAARLAGIFWVFDNKRTPVSGDEIDDLTVLSGILGGAWFLGETQRVLQAFSKSEGESRAEDLLAWLIARKQPTTLRNEILRMGPPGTRNRKNRDAALEVLRSRGLAETDKDPAGRQVVVLNPEIQIPKP